MCNKEVYVERTVEGDVSGPGNRPLLLPEHNVCHVGFQGTTDEERWSTRETWTGPRAEIETR